MESVNPWKFLAAFVLLFLILIFGTVFFQNQQTERNTYNGFEFALAGNGDDTLWVTQVQVKGQVYNFPFYHHPSAVEDVIFTEGLAEKITDNPQKPSVVYMTFNPDDGAVPVAASDPITRIFGTRYNMLNFNVKSALTKPDPNSTAEVLIVTCDDAVDGTLVVEFSTGYANSVTNTGNCVHVRYTNVDESFRVADRFAYELLKIM